MAKKSLIARPPGRRSTRRATTRAATAAGGRVPSTASSALCRICLRELAHLGMIPGMTKSSW